QVGEHDRPAVAIATERLGREVDVDTTGERERDDERRRRKVRGAGEGMDPPLEVPVAREDRRDDEVVLLDRARDRLVERARVADACRAAVPGEREAERLERLHEPGRLEVARDGL